MCYIDESTKKKKKKEKKKLWEKLVLNNKTFVLKLQ